jgi:hypothetical protein
MVAFTLTRNATFQIGKMWTKPSAKNIPAFKAYRRNLDDRKSPQVDTCHFEVDIRGPMVIDAVSKDIDYIKPKARVY